MHGNRHPPQNGRLHERDAEALEVLAHSLQRRNSCIEPGEILLDRRDDPLLFLDRRE